MLKRLLMITMTIAVMVLLSSIFHTMDVVYGEEAEESVTYHDVDDVYSTYSPSTDYTLGKAIYTKDGGIAVRSISTEQVTAGLSLDVMETITVTEHTALVIDVLFYSNLERTMKLDLVQADETVKTMQNGQPAYKAKGGNVRSTMTIENNAFNNNLGPSTGYRTGDTNDAYDQLVVPLSSYGYAIDDIVSLQGIDFYAPPWSTGHYHAYVLKSVSLTENFEVSDTFDQQVIWESATDSYEPCGDTDDNVDIRQLSFGQMWMEPSVNSSGTGIVQELVFKFPDALINESGLVDTASLKGLTYSFRNETDIAFNGHFKLYDAEGTSVANSNYMNLKTHKITKDGIEAHSNAKYFYPNTNTVGYSDVFVMYDFDTTANVTQQSTESFYSPTGDLPEEISPYFTFTYDNNQTIAVDSVYFEHIRILTEDPTVHHASASSSEDVSISATKGFVGSEIVFHADANGRDVFDVRLNGNPLSEEDVNELFAPSGLSVTMVGDMNLVILFGDESFYSITIDSGQNGVIRTFRDSFISGDPVLVLVEPDVGYELESLEINGSDVTDDVSNYAYTVSTGDRDLSITGSFRLATTYVVEPGATSSLYNSYPGVIWAEFDAVNVQTIHGFEPGDPTQSIGVIFEDIGKTVDESDMLVIDIHNMINMWRTFQIRIDGIANESDMTYYLLDRYNNIHRKTGTGIITESSAPANSTNDTLTVLKTEGFYGKIIIPIANFPGIETIDELSIHTDIKDKSHARFNVGDVSIARTFDPQGGLDGLVTIWSPADDNWRPYEEEGVYGKVSFMRQGEVSLQTVVANSYGYDSLYVSLPRHSINDEGYVDLEALGIDGIAIDVNNYNMVQHSMAIRIAGSDNPSLTDTSKTLWQTSISNHPASIIYPSGLVKSRNSAFIPYDDSGVFEGTIYIPFSSISFTNIGAFGEFPTLIQPVMRILPGSMNDTSYSSYDFEIKGIRLISDSSSFETHQITMSQIGGTLGGEIAGIQVTNAANNNVLDQTSVTFTITPNRGYVVSSVKYQMGVVDEQDAVLDSNNRFIIDIVGDLLVIALCEEEIYSIDYDLNEGTNHADNPESYTVEDRTIVLEAPEREGYAFLGWFDGETKVVEIPAGSIGDYVLEARWESTTGSGLLDWIGDHVVLSVMIGLSVIGLPVGTLIVLKKKRPL